MLLNTSFALNNDSNNSNNTHITITLSEDINNTNYTNMYNSEIGIIDGITDDFNQLPVVAKIGIISLSISVLITVLLFIVGKLIERQKESKKLEQFYTVNTYAEKLKPDDFKIEEYPDYIRKSTHDTVINLIKECEKKILIKGVTGLGKTRSVYEVIKEFGPKSYFIVLPSRKIKLPIWVPKDFLFLKRKFILFFDDLDKYIDENIDITNIINEFEKNSKYLIVIATCKEEEFENLKKDKIHEKFKIVEQDELSTEDGEKLAKSVGKEFNPKEFDGTAGSIIFDSPRKKYYWNNFDESKRNILRSIKLLHISFIYNPDIDLLMNVHRTIFDPHNDKFNTHFHDLKEKKFISLKSNTVSCQDYYISNIVEDYPLGNEHISGMLKLKNILTETKRDDYLFYLGNSFYFKEEYLHAKDCYDESLKINPKNVSAWITKGIALVQLEKYEEAITCCNNALEINPKNVSAWITKYIALDNLGKYEEVITCCDKALDINPKKESAWITKGIALVQLGKYEEAITCYDNALEINPKNESASFNRACSYSLMGNKEKAISNLKRSIELNANNKEKAKNDTDFEKYWNDEDFKKLSK